MADSKENYQLDLGSERVKWVWIQGKPGSNATLFKLEFPGFNFSGVKKKIVSW